MRYLRNKDKILHPELSYRILGGCFETHNELGRFRNEMQYADYLENFFKKQGVAYAREKALPVAFNGEKTRRNVADFIVDGKVILEIKAVPAITKQYYY